MWNLFEWLWIINKFRFGSVFSPFHRHFSNEFCQKHVIISLSLSVSTRIECNAINIAFEMLSSQSHVHKLWARRSFAPAFQFAIVSAPAYTFVPFFHIIPISEYWLNLRSCLPLWFQRMHLQNVMSLHPAAAAYAFASIHLSVNLILYVHVYVYLAIRRWFQNARCIWIETENVTFMRFQHIPLFSCSSYCTHSLLMSHS